MVCDKATACHYTWDPSVERDAPPRAHDLKVVWRREAWGSKEWALLFHYTVWLLNYEIEKGTTWCHLCTYIPPHTQVQTHTLLWPPPLRSQFHTSQTIFCSHLHIVEPAVLRRPCVIPVQTHLKDRWFAIRGLTQTEFHSSGSLSWAPSCFDGHA